MKTIILLMTILTTTLASAKQSEKDLIVTCQPTQSHLSIQRVSVFGSIADLYVTLEIQYKNGQTSQDDEALSMADIMDADSEGELIGYGSDNLNVDLNFISGVGSIRAALITGRFGQEMSLVCNWADSF